MPLTRWRPEDRNRQQDPNVTHHNSHSLSGGPRTSLISMYKYSSPRKPLTFWRAEDKRRQYGPNPGHHTHSLQCRGHALSTWSICGTPGKPLTCWTGGTVVVSKYQLQVTKEATHSLECQ